MPTAARYSGHRSHRVRIDDYTTIELGAEIQWPLDRHLGSRQVRAGAYAIVRFFSDLDLASSFAGDLGYVHELGLSFSTEPELRLARLKLPLGREIDTPRVAPSKPGSLPSAGVVPEVSPFTREEE